mgnify:CR=1 FL=1
MANDPNAVYQVLIKPLVTEKSTVLQSLRNQYSFKVHPDANKSEIRKAVEQLFDVKVKAVNTVKIPGKAKRMFGRPGHTKPWKKALVQLAEGESIDII